MLLFSYFHTLDYNQHTIIILDHKAEPNKKFYYRQFQNFGSFHSFFIIILLSLCPKFVCLLGTDLINLSHSNLLVFRKPRHAVFVHLMISSVLMSILLLFIILQYSSFVQFSIADSRLALMCLIKNLWLNAFYITCNWKYILNYLRCSTVPALLGMPLILIVLLFTL